MQAPRQLRIPGPTPLPPEVLASLGRPMISHRGDDFHRLLLSIEGRVQEILGLTGEVMALTASGTGGLEAAVANTVQPGDRVLSVSIGHFGERFAEIAERFGATVDYLRSPVGSPADPSALAQQVAREPYDVVLLTHCETSTGVLNDVPALSRALGSGDDRPLLLLDGVSSLGAVPLGLSQADVDIAITASQKAWMTPPGLSLLSVSPRAWERIESCRSPRCYLDLALARRYAKRGETPWTPALTLLYGLDAALDLILAEGPATVAARHVRLACRIRAGLRDLGFTTLADEIHASPTVTAALLPPGVEYPGLTDTLSSEYGIEVAGGQGDLRGKIVRIGHMGHIHDADVDYLLDAFSAAVRQCRSAAARA